MTIPNEVAAALVEQVREYWRIQGESVLNIVEPLMSPKAYEEMRDKFKQQGLSDKAAKSKAAAIYNSKHPNAPVTGKNEPKKGK